MIQILAVLIQTIYTPLAWLLTIIPILLMHKVLTKGEHYGQPPIQRYALPGIFRWMETPDEQLPGGLYEPQILRCYNRFGPYITAWVWVGTRNIGHGITWAVGKPCPKAIKDMTEEEKEAWGVWEKTITIGFLKIMWGWKSKHDWYKTKVNLGLWAVPFFTIRLKNQD